MKGNEEISASGFCLDNECWRLYEQRIQKVLSQGLSDRVKIVRVTWRNVPFGYSVENVSNKILSLFLLRYAAIIFSPVQLIMFWFCDIRVCHH